MKFDKNAKHLSVVGLLSLVSVSGFVWAQQGPPFGPPRGGPGGRGPGGPGGFPGGPGGGFPGPGGGFPGPGGPGGQFEEEGETAPLPPPKVTIEVKDGYRYITSNGIPDHPTGKFPHPGNPGRISAQDYKFRMPVKPVVGEATPARHGVFGIGVNGIPFDPATNEFWNNNRAWNYDALSGKIYLGTDSSNAHVQPGGIYHYHGLPHGLIAKVARKNQMTLIGYAADGFPMYAAQGHAAANDPKSPLKKLRSSYRLKEGTRPGGNQGPGGVYDGTFSADWEYVAGAGDLDECNGRTGVTPEYPQGTYYYAVTDEFPFISRYFRGTIDPSFRRQGPPGGQGGPGGPGGQNRPGGQSGPGFGGPGGQNGFGGQGQGGQGQGGQGQGGPGFGGGPSFGGPGGQGGPGFGGPGGFGGQGPGGPGGAPGGASEPNIQGPTIEDLTQLLGLTPQQQTKIKSVLDASQKQIEEILTPAQRTRMQQLREQSNSVPGRQALER